MAENNLSYGTEVSATWAVKFYDIVYNFIALWFCNIIFIVDLQKVTYYVFTKIGVLLLSKIGLKCDKDYSGNFVFCDNHISVVISCCAKNVSIVYCYTKYKQVKVERV